MENIEFFHNEPSIIKLFPIIESKNLKLNWVKKARQDFQNKVEESNDKNPKFKHLLKCPGIFELFKYGYIVTLHRDIIIKKMDDETSNPYQIFFYHLITKNSAGESLYDIRVPIRGFAVSVVSESSMNLIAKPPWASSNFILKIDTGWHVIAPKGVKFIMLPIAYPDTFDFTSTIGIFNPALSTDINFQMYWNEIETETLIRAGTPLGQLIPISEKKYKMVQRIMNQQDRDWVKKLRSAYSSTQVSSSTMRSKIVDMYNKYWKR